MCAGTAPMDRRTSAGRALSGAATNAPSSTSAMAALQTGFGIRDSGFAGDLQTGFGIRDSGFAGDLQTGFGIRHSGFARGFANPWPRRRPNLPSPESRIPNPVSVPRRLPDRLQNVGRLREDGLFEVGVVRDRTVQRSHALPGGVEVLEQLAGDPRGELRAKTAHHLILVGDDDAIGARDVSGDRLPVIRDKR